MLAELAVSSSTFIDMGKPISYGINTVKGLAKRELYAPEIDEAIKAAEEFGLGLEIAYRVGLRYKLDQIKKSGIPVDQIHGPIVWNLEQIIHASSGLKDLVFGVGMAGLANGTISSDWEETKKATRDLGAKRIVLHPNGAEILYKNRGVIFGQDDQLVVAIEPDFKRLSEKPGIVWKSDEVVRIANLTGQGVLLDTSHTGITYNNVEAMFSLYEKYKQEVKRGVVAIHFSVAIPGKDRSEFFTSNPGTGARPLYKNTPDAVKGAYREFYQQVVSDKDFNGPFVLEMWSFPNGNSMDDRRKAVEETLEVLNGSNAPEKTYR